MILGPQTQEPAVDYPTGDGKPLAETPIHRDNLLGLIEVLRRHFAGNDRVYVSGNMLLYYERGQNRKHVSPDVFVVLDIPDGRRDAYFTWVEGKAPDVVFEFTSPSTRKEDLKVKYALYERTLRVPEFFLFDPIEQYLKPSMQGYRLVGGRYEPIESVAGRLPSQVLGLHLERQGTTLRLYDPARGAWIPTPAEAEAAAEAAQRQAEADRQQAETERRRAEAARRETEDENRRLAEALRQADEARRQAAEESERLRRELDALRRRASEP